MSKQPKISIITACYNSEKTLEDTIKSIVSQTYQDIEYLIIDGGSTDRTMEIVKNHKESINYVVSECDNGIYNAFNKGVKAATGDVLYFLGSDDFLSRNDIIEKVMNEFSKDSSLKVLYGNVVMLDEKNSFEYINGKEITIEHFRKGDMTPHQGFFVKKEVFEKIGLFDEKFQIAADRNFVIECFKQYTPNEIKYLNESIATFRQGGISSDLKMRKNIQGEIYEILSNHFPEGVKQSSIFSENDINIFYRMWLESLLLRKEGATALLLEEGVKKVAIFGILKTGLYLKEDLKITGIDLVAFIDNNKNMQGKFIEGIPIMSQGWLTNQIGKIDAVIVSIENNNDTELINELKRITNYSIKIVSWKELF